MDAYRSLAMQRHADNEHIGLYVHAAAAALRPPGWSTPVTAKLMIVNKDAPLSHSKGELAGGDNVVLCWAACSSLYICKISQIFIHAFSCGDGGGIKITYASVHA